MSTVWRLHPRAQLKLNDQGSTLMDTWNAELSRCNPSATMLLKGLQEGAESQQLVLSLVEKFEVEESDAREDVSLFLDQLQKLRMLTRDD